MAGDENDYEQLAYQQRLKAALHYTVGQICEENAQTHDVQFTKQFIAALAETTYKYTASVGTDIEAFAKHAKRTTINADDIKLLVRKSPQLHEHMTELASQLSTENEEKKAKSKRARPKKTSTAAPANQAATDEDSNL